MQILSPETGNTCCQLGPTEYVPLEDGDRIHFPKRRVLNKRQNLENTVTCRHKPTGPTSSTSYLATDGQLASLA
jgi:hypothetical protein